MVIAMEMNPPYKFSFSNVYEIYNPLLLVVCAYSLNTLPLSSHRLIKGEATPYLQNFTFVNTSYTDDKTRFTCVGNTLDESEDTEMGVLCKRTHRPIISIKPDL